MGLSYASIEERATSLFEPMGSQRDAASVIFNLPGYRVVDAVDLPLGGRRVKVQPADVADGCPDCGVVSARVHAWTEQQVRDIPHAGSVQVVVRKPRLGCAEPLCGRRTFTSATAEMPLRARCTTRLKTAGADSGDRLGPGRRLGCRRVRNRLVDGPVDDQHGRGAVAGGRSVVGAAARDR